MPASDKTFNCFIFLIAGRILIASRPSQSLMYSSCRTEPNESAMTSILLEVRREHSLRFIDLNAGAEETSALSPTSESLHAPLTDIVAKAGKLCDDLAKVEGNM